MSTISPSRTGRALRFAAGQDINLMLRDDVVDAVRENRFAIYAVENIDEAIEILTGQKAGARRSQSPRFGPPHLFCAPTPLAADPAR